MKALSSEGKVLNAEFDVVETPSGIEVVLHSNGGISRGRPAYNADYIEALEAILIRLGAIGGILVGAWVDSKALANLSLDERLVRFQTDAYPIRLADIDDVADFRLKIRRSVSRIGKAKEHPPGTGNKKLRLAITFNGRPSLSVIELALRVGDLEEQSFVKLFDDPVGDLDQLVTLPNAPDFSDSGVRKRIWELARDAKPFVKHRLSRYVERGQVGQKVKEANNYSCQFCKALGQVWDGFIKPDGTHYRYVEAHHVVPVSTLADDVLGPQNVVTACPNHHRQLHYGGVTVRDLGEEFEFALGPNTLIRVTKFRDTA